MQMTEELKQVYANHEDTNRYYETLEIYSPAFGSEYVINEPEAQVFKLENGTSLTWQPYPFSVKVPDIGSDQQDMSIQMDGTFQELIVKLEQATVSNSLILVVYRVYREGLEYPQTTKIQLNVTSVSLKNGLVSLSCTRPDLFKRMFPSGDKAIFDSRFDGLLL